jgi:DNA-directed RNA polymerase specialized sigma24 family protein
MFVDEVSTRESLARMVRIMTANGALQDDLLQEALIHLWLTEVGRPGQTRSWYLQSCKYHLLHYLAAGRSVDSGKRRAGQLQFVDVTDSANEGSTDLDSGDSVLGCVSARDIIALLWPHLKPQERAVLECFADGLRLREIGRKLGVSHTLVVRHRRKIASLLNRFETNAMIPRGAFRPNGFVRNGTFHARNGHRKSGARGIGPSLPALIR